MAPRQPTRAGWPSSAVATGADEGNDLGDQRIAAALRGDLIKPLAKCAVAEEHCFVGAPE